MDMITQLTYDIKNEQDYLKCYDDNPIQKFYNYKTIDNNFDCDVSLFAIEQAKAIYPFSENYTIRKQPYCNKKYELYSEDSKLVFRGDTCNSFHTLYRIAVQQLKNYWNICNQYNADEYLKNLLASHKKLSEDFERELPIDLGRLFKEFAKITHTVPNFILLPIGLNATRYPLTCDNFSLFLYAVYSFMNEHQEFYLRNIYGDSVDLAIQYLKTFDSWANYVDTNYLESYLDKNSFPKEFIRGQFKNFENLLEELGSIPIEGSDRKSFFRNNRIKIEKCTCPKNHDEFTEYLSNVVSTIEQRSKQMSAVYSS